MKPKGFQPVDSVFPLQGLDLRTPSTMLDPRFSPVMSNVMIEEGVLESRAGYEELEASLPVDDDVLGVVEFEEEDGTRNLVAVTVDSTFLFDPNWAVPTEPWTIMGLVLDDCESVADWTFDGDVTGSNEGGSTGGDPDVVLRKTGTYSMKMICAAGLGAGDKAAYQTTIATFNAEKYTALSCWVYTTVALNAEDWSVVLSEEIDGDKGPGTYVEFKLPAVPADTWTLVRIAGSCSGLDADNKAESLSIFQLVDKGEMTIYIDDIRLNTKWTGDETNVLDWEISTDDNGKYLMLTNGLDHPIWWDGGSNGFKNMSVDIASFTTCATIASFFDRLLLGGVTVGGAYSPQDFAWCVIGDFTDWLGAGSGQQLIDSKGPIKRLYQQGDRMVVYSSDSIGVITYLGGDVLYAFEQLIQNTRLVSPRAIVSVGPYHVYLSRDGFYIFDGSRMLRPVGEQIDVVVREELALSLWYRSFMFLDAGRRRAFCVIPHSDAETKVYVLDYDVYNIDDRQWTVINYHDRPQSMGFYTRDTSVKWNSPSITGVLWSESTYPWVTGSIKEDFPVMVMGVPGKVLILDETQNEDNGEPVVATWESKDFVLPERYRSQFARWIEIEFELTGAAVTIEYSIDKSESWTVVETLTLTGQWDRYKSYVDVSSQTFRVRLTSTSRWSMRWLRVWFRAGGSR